MFAQFASNIFTRSVESVSPQYAVFWNIWQRVFLCFVWRTCHSCAIIACLGWELLSFKTVKMAEGLLEKKKRTRKILNWYRMFAELLEALAGARALDEMKDFKRSRPRSPSTASPWEFNSCWRPAISQLKWLQRTSGKKQHLWKWSWRSSAKAFIRENSVSWPILWARQWNNNMYGEEYREDKTQ